MSWITFKNREELNTILDGFDAKCKELEAERSKNTKIDDPCVKYVICAEKEDGTKYNTGVNKDGSYIEDSNISGKIIVCYINQPNPLEINIIMDSIRKDNGGLWAAGDKAFDCMVDAKNTSEEYGKSKYKNGIKTSLYLMINIEFSEVKKN
jgi:hypothetical protein